MWVLMLAGHKALSPFTLFSLNFDTGFFLPYRLQSGRFHTVKNKDGPSPLSNIRPYQAQGTPTNHSLVLRQWAAPASRGRGQLSPRTRGWLSSALKQSAQCWMSPCWGGGPYQPQPTRPPREGFPTHRIRLHSCRSPDTAWERPGQRGETTMMPRLRPAGLAGGSREVWLGRPGIQM